MLSIAFISHNVWMVFISSYISFSILIKQNAIKQDVSQTEAEDWRRERTDKTEDFIH